MNNKEISEKVLGVFDELCKKPKKFCALCDRSLGKPTKKELADHKGRMFCRWVSFRHPKYKSKTYKLCGSCYASVLTKSRNGDTNEQK